MAPAARRQLRSIALGIASLAAAILAGCSAGSEDGARNVVLVTIDTLRADHLGSYGYERPTSPHFDALAERSTLFTRALASAPWTLPSHASLFTGLDPHAHGAVSVLDASHPFNARPLDRAHTTLAEALRAEGFRTGAFVANDVFLGRRTRLDQGFETYAIHREPGLRLNQRIADWLDQDDPRPFFLFVNYMDCHRPYNTRSRRPVVDPPAENDPALLDELKDAVMGGDGGIPTELARRVVAQYDTGIANADAALGQLLARLDERGVDDSTLVVVTSDHGEYFGEHRLVEHSKDVYQEALHVPLLVREAGQRAPGRDDRVVTSADVPHLVLDGLPREIGARARARLAPRGADPPALTENYFSRAGDLKHPVWGERFRRVRRAVVDWPLKYIESSDGAHELYDLEADPLELRNLVQTRPEDAERLAATLADRVGPMALPAPAPAEDLTPAERAALRELGYLD